MSDAPPAAPPAPPADPPKDAPPASGAPSDAEKDWKAEHEKVLAEARKWEQRAKENHGAKKELDDLKKSGMTELEKAVAEATEAGKAEARREAAAQLVDARIEAAAANRLSELQLAQLLEGIDRARFLTEDGQVDAEKVKKFVDAVAPATAPADLGQGNRGSGAPSDFNAAIRARMRR
jgi:hypothetical protein